MPTTNTHHQLKQLRKELKRLRLEVKKTHKKSNSDNKKMGKLLLKDIKSLIRAINQVEERAFSLRNIIRMTKDVIQAYQEMTDDGIVEPAELIEHLVDFGDKYIDDGTVLDQSLAAAKAILKDGKITALEVAKEVFKVLGNSSDHPLLQSIANNGHQILEDDKVEMMEVVAGVLSVMTHFDKNQLLQDIAASGQLVLADGVIEPMELIQHIVQVADKHVDDGSMLDESLAGAHAILKDGKITALEVANEVCKVLAKSTQLPLLQSIAEHGMDILADQKIELMEVIAGVLAVMSDHSKNELMQDIAQGGQLVLADGTISPMELVQQVVAVADKHVDDGSLLDQSLASAHSILKDGRIDPMEVAKAVFQLIAAHVDHPLLKSIARQGNKILADDKFELLEIMSGVLSITAQHSQQDILKSLAESGQVVLADGTVEAEEVLKEVLKLSAKHLSQGTDVSIAGEMLSDTASVEDSINHFLETQINNKEKELLNINYEVPRSKWGRLIYSFDFDLDMTASMSGQLKAMNKVALGLDFRNSNELATTFGLDLSFTIPIIQQKVSFELEMGVEATLHTQFKAGVTMTVEANLLKGILPPSDLDTELEMSTTFFVPKSIVDSWNAVASWSNYIDPVASKYNQKMGRYALFTLVLPGYSLQFDITNANFVSKKLGNLSIKRGKDVDTFIKKVESFLPWT